MWPDTHMYTKTAYLVDTENVVKAWKQRASVLEGKLKQLQSMSKDKLDAITKRSIKSIQKWMKKAKGLNHQRLTLQKELRKTAAEEKKRKEALTQLSQKKASLEKEVRELHAKDSAHQAELQNLRAKVASLGKNQEKTTAELKNRIAQLQESLKG